MKHNFEYKFVRLEPGFFSATEQAHENYPAEIQKHAEEGWRLVQIFAPFHPLRKTDYYELIFERPARRDDSKSSKIQGLRTVIYHVPDLAKAMEWYSKVLEREPYFNEPFYVGYSVGGFELGLVPDGVSGAGGTVAYWGVTDAAAAVIRLESLGATIKEALQDVGGGIRVATVADPFGNLLGVIENPNFSREKVE